MGFPTVYNTVSVILRIMMIKHEIGNEDCGVLTGIFCALESCRYFSISHMICQRAHAMAFTRLFRARGQVPSTAWLRCMLAVYSSHLATGIRCLSQLWPCQSADGQITTIRPSAGYCLEQLICCYSLVYSAVSCFLIAVLGSKPEL